MDYLSLLKIVKSERSIVKCCVVLLLSVMNTFFLIQPLSIDCIIPFHFSILLIRKDLLFCSNLFYLCALLLFGNYDISYCMIAAFLCITICITVIVLNDL